MKKINLFFIAFIFIFTLSSNKVINAQQAIFTLEDSDGCAPFEVTIHNSSIDANEYYWDFGDGNYDTTSSSVFTHIYENSPGGEFDYDLKLIVSDSLGLTDTMIQIVTVYPQVIANFYAYTDTAGYSPFTVSFIDQSEGASYWNWNFGDGDVSGNMNPNHTFINDLAFDTTYIVTLIVCSYYGCCDTFSLEITVYSATGIIVHNSKNSSVILFPNPNKGTFLLSFYVEKPENIIIQIINDLGQNVCKQEHKKFKGKYNKEIDISSFKNGIYMLNIKVGENTYTKNISVMR